MTYVETTAAGQDEALSLEFTLEHAPKTVWRALTDPELLSEWLLPSVGLELEVGARFTFTAPPQPEWDGVVYCRVLEVAHGRRLRYGWVVGDLETEVTFTLVPTASGTRLTVEQTGFKPEQKRNFGGARYGWRMMGARLVELLDRLPDGSKHSKG